MTDNVVDLHKIRSLRKLNKITIEEMSKLLGYESLNGYYYLEIGRGKFTAEKLAKVADVLGVPLTELFIKSNRF